VLGQYSIAESTCSALLGMVNRPIRDRLSPDGWADGAHDGAARREEDARAEAALGTTCPPEEPPYRRRTVRPDAPHARATVHHRPDVATFLVVSRSWPPPCVGATLVIATWPLMLRTQAAVGGNAGSRSSS